MRQVQVQAAATESFVACAGSVLVDIGVGMIRLLLRSDCDVCAVEFGAGVMGGACLAPVVTSSMNELALDTLNPRELPICRW